MVSAKVTVKKVLDNLPDDCTMDEVLDRLFVTRLVEERLEDFSDPHAKTYTTDQVREMVAQWRTK